MSKKSALSTDAAGNACTAAGLWACSQLTPLRETVRVERSIQIGCPAEEVYAGFALVERMPQFIRSVVSVDTCGDISVWIAEIEGRRYGWDVEIVQVVPKQLIGWRSCRGPKHSGRISFLSQGEETHVHLEMNYGPGIILGRLFDGTFSATLGGVIEVALRDLKTTLESAHPHWDAGKAAVKSEVGYEAPGEQATGT
jgi:uncharacterized membrane protein